MGRLDVLDLDRHAEAPDGIANLFNYSRQMRVEGSDRQATEVDTNMWRSGDLGLPQSFESLVFDWYATIDGVVRGVEHAPELPEPVAEWAKSVHLQLHYNRKHYYEATLFDLVMRAGRPHLVDDAIDTRETPMPDVSKWHDGTKPALVVQAAAALERKGLSMIHIRENLSFGVRATQTSADAMERMNAWQRQQVADPEVRDVLARLSMTPAREALRPLYRRLSVPALRIKIALWGVHSRVVV